MIKQAVQQVNGSGLHTVTEPAKTALPEREGCDQWAILDSNQ
jgi:hypothetical protein